MMREYKAYKEVLEHRSKCKKWGREFCLDCFGGGLTKYTLAIVTQILEEFKQAREKFSQSGEVKIISGARKQEDNGKIIRIQELLDELDFEYELRKRWI